MRQIIFLLASVVLAAPTAHGAVSDKDFEQLRQQLAAVSQRLDELAAENAQLKRTQDQTASAVADVRTSVAEVESVQLGDTTEPWSDRIRLDGDFRFRYEKIDVENSPSQRRNRIRARTSIKADVVDDVEIGFGLATGGDNPVSTNQTIGNGGSSKNIRLDLAYADWEATDGLHLIVGKYKNPLLRVGRQALMWDGDWTPEGFAVKYTRDWFFLNSIGTWLESDNSNNNDSFSWGTQFGARGQIGGATLTGGLAYYSIKTKGKSTTFGNPVDPGGYFGNTAVEAGGLPCGSTAGASCVYQYDYLLTEVFAEAAFDLGGWPAAIFLDYVKNSDPVDNNTGWAIGTRFGQAKARGEFQFSYFYADKETDSMLGLLTDSDFGDGGTDSKGHFLQLNFGINQNLFIGARYFINEIDIASGNKRDYDRLTIDAQWKWK